MSTLAVWNLTDLQPSRSPTQMANFQFTDGGAAPPAQFIYATAGNSNSSSYDYPQQQQVNGYALQQSMTAYPQQQNIAYRTAADYKQMDPVVHVYERPNMYVGSDERHPRGCWVFNTQTGRMQLIQLDYVPAAERIFLEIMGNCADNALASREVGLDPGTVVVTMDGQWVTVINYGLPIPVEMHETGVPVPERIFGTLLTSSTYGKARHGIGTNGVGAKATNIYSKEFLIDIIDTRNRKRYQQRWYNNMLSKDPAVITDLESHVQTASTTVRYLMDFARFKYDPAVGYPAEALALYERHAVEISFTTKIPISFNSRPYNVSSIVDLALLYYTEEQVKSAIIYYIWPAGTQIVEHGKPGWPRTQSSAGLTVLPDLEMLVLDTPDSSHHISFANSIMTPDGGTHVEGLLKVISDSAVKTVNEKLVELIGGESKSKGKGKGKGKGAVVAKKPTVTLDASEKRALSVTLADVRPHLSLLISVRVVDPGFDSQAKTRLMSPQIKVPIPDELLKKMEHWQLLDRLYAAAEAKQFQRLTKDDGKRRGHGSFGKGIDANYAGRAKHSAQCILVTVEGDSAKGTAAKLFSHGGHNVRDHVGILPIRGKGLNVMGKSPLRILRNEEIKHLKAMLGLQENLNYLDPVNFATLRYGGVYLLSDADNDGKHITAIELNLFFCRYPSLLAAGYVHGIDTPYLIIKKGNTVIPFYSEEGYQAWKDVNPGHKTWNHRYIKGLGTLEDEDIKNEYQNPHFVQFTFDQDTPQAMQLAFHKKAADHRKQFMAQWKSMSGIDELRVMPISTYIYQNWTKYSMANVIRALPNLLSGMKRTHMKVIQACHSLWGGINFGKTYQPKKIQAVAGHCLEKVSYHHGADILGKVIIGMCQGFVGALNMPLIDGSGNIGTRQFGGSDAAAARYPNARPSSLFPYIYHPEDRDILEYLEDDGVIVEPADFFPTVPVCLINGIIGVGTGHSTTTVNHHPLDCVHLLKLLLTGTPVNDLPDLIPHYVGFTGTLQVIDRNAKKRDTAVDAAANPMLQWQLQQQSAGLATATATTIADNVPPSSGLFNFEPLAAASAEDEVKDEQDDEDDVPLDVGIELDDEDASDIRSRLSLVTRGIYRIQGNRIVITELPIGMTPKHYYDIGQEWLEQKECLEFIDRSSPDLVYFEIGGFKNSPTFTNLRLESHVPMSNMRFLDHHGSPVRYDTSLDILYAFYCQRLPKYQLRKDHMLRKIASEVDKLLMKMKFITLVKNKVVEVRDRPEEDIIADLAQYQIGAEDWVICRDMKIWNLTTQKITAMQAQIDKLVQERNQLAQTSREQLWLKDLDEFEKVCGNRFGPRGAHLTTTVNNHGMISTPWQNSHIATTSTSTPTSVFISAPVVVQASTPLFSFS